MKKGKLFLVPIFLGDANDQIPLVEYQLNEIRHIKHFICENGKTARAALKKFRMQYPLQEMFFYEMDKHEKQEVNKKMQVLFEGEDMALMSEAGLPCVADPGNEYVAYAHKNEIVVHPIIGPSSIMLALMASGFNGQHFTFHGYIPVKEPERSKKIKLMEEHSYRTGCSHIFIETPYRNITLIEQLKKTLQGSTGLCIAANLLQSSQRIISKSVRELNPDHYQDLHKIPAVFILHATPIIR